MALMGIVANATPVDGNNLSVAVQLPDGSFKRYEVSLLDPHIQKSLEAAARVTATPVNDALIKANLNLIVKGLQLDLSDPVVDPPPPPDPAEAPFLADLQTLNRATNRAGLTLKGVDVDTLRANLQTVLDAHPAFAKFLSAL